MTSHASPPATYTELRAVFINTRLKVSPEPSHTGLLMTMSQSVMEAQGVSVEHIRAADPPHHVHRPRRRFDHRIDAAVVRRLRSRPPNCRSAYARQRTAGYAWMALVGND